TSQGTSRYVDSSVERLQLHVTGLTEERYAIVCNGKRLPLRSTGRRDEFVAGVRYRAWQPPSALHPTIKPHAPLVFDVIDTWNGCSIGGCSYHVSYPGRLAPHADFGSFGRFFPSGSVPGPMAPPPINIDDEFPLTLDLRRYSQV
ncbi:MAG: transglutaminase family protein, partial [Halomonas sp.]